ncbi:MAG: hypothetical protein SH807_10270 [Blastochloris sp.]|nr:hypothetical protein [Blastochloris sp.]
MMPQTVIPATGRTWTNLDTRSAETFASRNQTKSYTVATPELGYRSYRLNVTLNNGSANLLQLSELKLYGPLVP